MKMTGKVSRVYKKIPHSSLGIFKVTDYPFEERDFKPFALSRICVLDDKFLVVRMWSFEVDPKATVTAPTEDIFNDSTLSFVIEKNGKMLVFTVNNKGVVFVQNEEKSPVSETQIHTHFFTGEDLQGIYWGAEIKIDFDFLEKHTGITAKDESFKGNIYKTSFGEKKHFGGFFEVKQADLFCKDSLGTFEITQY